VKLIEFFIIDKIQVKPNSSRLTAEEIYKWMVFDSAVDFTPDQINELLRKLLRRDYKDMPVYQYDAEHVCNLILGIVQRTLKDIEKNRFDDIRDYLPTNTI